MRTYKLLFGLGTALLVAAAFGDAARAESPRTTLTLGDAVALALRQNPSLAAAVASLEIAEAGLVEARGAEDLVLSSRLSWMGLRGLESSGLLLDDARAAISLGRMLPTGGHLGIELGGELTRTLTLQNSSQTPISTYQPAALLSFSHPLLRGFGVGIARAGRRRARSRIDQATLQREAAAADLIRSVVQTYWEIAFATTQLQVRQSSRDLANEQLRAVQANIATGKQPRSAAAEVEVTIALREDERLQAEQAVRERTLELQQLLGMESAGKGAVVPAEELEYRPANLDARLAIEAARQQNPQLRALRAQRAGALVEVDVTRNGLLPQLDLTAAAGPTGNAADASAAFSQLAHFDGYQVQAGLSFSMPLQRNTALGQAVAARENLHRLALNEVALGRQIEAGVHRALNMIAQAGKRIEVLARATDLAALDLEAEQARFQVGRASNFDVLRRQDELARAKLQVARAKTDYLQGQALLEALTGEILERFAVELRRK